MKSRAWRWPDRGQFVLALLLAGMESATIYLVALLLQPILIEMTGAPYAVPVPLLLALEFVGWLICKRLLGAGWPERRVQAIAGLLGLLFAGGTFALAFPDEFRLALSGTIGPLVPGVILAEVAWARGLLQATESIKFEAIYRAFRLGTGLFLAGGLLVGVGWTPDDGAFGPAALLFFACGLGGLAAANLLARAAEAGIDDRPARLDLRWSLVVGGSVGAVLLIGAIGVAAGFDRFIGALQNIVGFIVAIIAWVLYIIIYAITYVLFTLIFGPLADWLNNLPRKPPEEQQGFVIPGPPDLGQNAPVAYHLPGNFDLPLRGIATVLILVLVVWLFTRLLRRYQAATEHDSDFERESLGGWDLLWQQFLAWLRHLLRRDQLAPAAATVARGDSYDQRADREEILSIRRIYAALQKDAAAAGHPRRPAQTPDEYLLDLRANFPAAAADLAAITHTYDAARYGPPPLPAPLVAEANQRWQRIKGELRVTETRDK